MTKPDYLETLIDKAQEKVGSDYKLAKTLGQPRSAISMWRAGKRSCPVADQVLMAELAGLDPQAWSARALIAQHEGTAKGEALYKALGKALLATGAAVASFGANALATSLIEAVNLIRCIQNKVVEKRQSTCDRRMSARRIYQPVNS
jgi:hypothetical protein